MRFNWLPWKFLIRYLSKGHGFLDPFQLMSRVRQFAQPSEVDVPVELLRAGALFHARGLVNSQAIQHNLDWVWPYWIEQQFRLSPRSFIPRAFSLTHVNLTHRNWTSVGIPGEESLPVVDPRGLVMPFQDSWSLDVWVVGNDEASLLPSKEKDVSQDMITENGTAVRTECRNDSAALQTTTCCGFEQGRLDCVTEVRAEVPEDAHVAVSLRPCNPEGISFIHEVSTLSHGLGWDVNNEHRVLFSEKPETNLFANYREGDVFQKIKSRTDSSRDKISCNVGMATSAALFSPDAEGKVSIAVRVPLQDASERAADNGESVRVRWRNALEPQCRISVPDASFCRLYEKTIRTLIMQSPSDVYAGPFTYKRFWFRDAAFILHAMLLTGFSRRVEKIIDRFMDRQKYSGYFESQKGEWDSNGQVLWIIRRFCEVTGRPLKEDWIKPVLNGAEWIRKKRLGNEEDSPHAGLMPPGFSAEHLGPSDYYY